MILRHMFQYKSIAQVAGTAQDKFADSLVISCDLSYFNEHSLSRLHKTEDHKQACEAITGEYNKIGSVNGSPIYRQKEGNELFLSRDLSEFAHTIFKVRPTADRSQTCAQEHTRTTTTTCRIIADRGSNTD